jgi:type III secretory pathway component EscU
MKDLRLGLRVALLLIILFLLYLFCATFVPMTAPGIEVAKTVVPFLLGVIATLIGFYWGNSSKKSENGSQLKD